MIRRRLGIVLLIAGAGLVVTGFSRGAPPQLAPRAAAGLEVGGGTIPIGGRHTITPGEYRSRIWGPDARAGASERGRQAAAEDASRPQFRGWMGGVLVYALGDRPPEEDSGVVCPQVRAATARELRSNPHFIDIPSWLPPGVVEDPGMSGAACGSEVIMLARHFEVEPYGGTIGIVRAVGSRAVPLAATAERLSMGRVGDRPALMLAPLTDEGYGASAVVVVEEWGTTKVSGLNVSFDDLLRVAESLR